MEGTSLDPFAKFLNLCRTHRWVVHLKMSLLFAAGTTLFCRSLGFLWESPAIVATAWQTASKSVTFRNQAICFQSSKYQNASHGPGKGDPHDTRLSLKSCAIEQKTQAQRDWTHLDLTWLQSLSIANGKNFLIGSTSPAFRHKHFLLQNDFWLCRGPTFSIDDSETFCLRTIFGYFPETVQTVVENAAVSVMQEVNARFFKAYKVDSYKSRGHPGPQRQNYLASASSYHLSTQLISSRY